MSHSLPGAGLRVALIAVTLGGCATSQGDSLMKRGPFMEAEAAYDAELLIEDVTRPPAEEAKAAGDAKAAPEVEEVPQAGGETI